jgi:hypothetical protein
VDKSARLIIEVAAGALRSGTDPQIVREFLDRVLDLPRIETPEDFWNALDRAETNRMTR